MRRPVSAELRDSRITSTRGVSTGAPSLSASSLRTTGRQQPGLSIFLVRALVGGIGLQAFAFEQGVAFFEIEQGARSNRNGKQPGSVVTHGR